MKRGKELLENTAIIGIGNFSTKILSFLLLPIYTSLLSTSDYGLYDLFITISTFLVPCITLLMDESMFRFLIDCNTEDDKRQIISQTIIFTIKWTSLFSFLYLCLGLLFKFPYFILFLVFIISNIIVGLRNAITRGLGKIKMFAIINFISSFMIISLNILFIVVLRLGISSLLLSFIIANILTTLYVFIKLKIYKFILLKNYSKEKSKQMIKYSLPLVPNSISWTVVNLSDRIVISSFLGTSINGIYSVSYKFPNMMDTIYGFFYSAWKESAAKSLKDDDSYVFYNKIYIALTRFMWGIVIMMISLLPFVFNLLIKNEFANSYLYVPILILAMYYSNISGFFGGIFSAYKDTGVMGITTIVGALINLIVDILFIKYIGVWAAALSTLASTFTIYTYRKYKIKKYVSLENNFIFKIGSLISILIAFVLYYSSFFLVKVILLLLLTLYCVYINSDNLKLILNIFIKKNK